MKKLVCLILCMIMMFGVVSTGAFAVDNGVVDRQPLPDVVGVRVSTVTSWTSRMRSRTLIRTTAH